MNTSHLLAQIINPAIPSTIGSGTIARGGLVTGSFISSIIALMYVIAFITAFIFLLTAGFHWITSGGDKANLESARNKIIHSIIGLIVVTSTWAIMNLLAQFIGWEDFARLPIPTISVPTDCGSNCAQGPAGQRSFPPPPAGVSGQIPR